MGAGVNFATNSEAGHKAPLSPELARNGHHFTRYGSFLWYPMSAQPPHYWKTCLLPLLRRSHVLTAVACLALAGCATQGNDTQLSGSDGVEPLSLIGDRSTRDRYLSNVRSDPLGAYLASQDRVNRHVNPSLASTALNYLGIKYRFGGNTPSQGFDCSGLVRYAAEQSLGLKLPRRSAEMARLGESVKRAELERGDLVFFNTRGQRFSHVGIYLGDGNFVHAPSTGSTVRVESMSKAYWQKRYNGARRLASMGGSDAIDVEIAEARRKLATRQ